MRKNRKKIWMLSALLLLGMLLLAQTPPIWSGDKSRDWARDQPWLVGCNFIPSTAINELEMWQIETFDTSTINRELGWAQGIGMNTARVFLHYIPWQIDSKGFKERINSFLEIADRHQIRIMFVLFDDCWNADPQAGKQPDPKPGIHNSGWLQCPGKKMHNDSSSWDRLSDYTRDILSSFKSDKRILLWDLYNEPGNSSYGETSLPLLKKVYEWAWAVRPSQPLTCGIWYDNASFRDWQLANSDVISFHNYEKAEDLEKQIRELGKLKRPLICSEYMARTRGSRFESHLPVFKKYQVAAINWGFVAGKTNTIYQWDKPVPDGSEPRIWFHDIFRRDGSPYDPVEIAFIRKITSSP